MNDSKVQDPAPSKDIHFVKDLAIVYGLWALLVALPLYQQFLNNSNYLLVNRIELRTIYLFTAAISILLPGIIGLLLFGLKSIHHRAYKAGHLCVIAFLFSLTFVPMMNQVAQGGDTVFLTEELMFKLALIISCFAVYQYASTPFIQTMLVFTSPFTILIPGYFLTHDAFKDVYALRIDITESYTPIDSINNPTPIVIIIYDELPTVTLMDAAGRLDAKRFPNFSALAGEATWYKYASSVHYATLNSIPAILSGNMPGLAQQIPVRQNYPNNLIALLENHYSLNVLEPATRLNTDEVDALAPELHAARQKMIYSDSVVILAHAILPHTYANAWLPMQGGTWGGLLDTQADTPSESAESDSDDHSKKFFDIQQKSDDAFQTWWDERDKEWEEKDIWGLDATYAHIAQIKDFPETTFHFLHILLPHYPYDMHPSKNMYNKLPYHIATPYRNKHSEMEVNYLRHGHTIKTAAGDTILGDYITALKEAGIYEKAIIVVTSDHGVAFDEQSNAREIQENNMAAIAFTPLLIKYPGQTEAIVDESNVQSIDIAPTIFDVLQVEPKRDTDGRSLLDEQAAIPATKKMVGHKTLLVTKSFGEAVAEHKLLEDEYRQALSLDDSKADLYHFGPGLKYVGKLVQDLDSSALQATFDSASPELLETVNLANRYVPSLIEGTVDYTGDIPADKLVVAIVINGIVEGTTQPFIEKGVMKFNKILSDQIFKPTDNTLEFRLLSL